MDRLGYGPSPPPAAPVIVNNNVVSAEALAAARDNLRTIETHAKRVSDSERVSESSFPAGGGAEGPALPDSAGSPVEGEGEDGAD